MRVNVCFSIWGSTQIKEPGFIFKLKKAEDQILSLHDTIQMVHDTLDSGHFTNVHMVIILIL